MKITLTLSPRFREWCRENPKETLARVLKDRKGVCVTNAPSACNGAELYER
jgi:hypothetical protein